MSQIINTSFTIPDIRINSHSLDVSGMNYSGYNTYSGADTTINVNLRFEDSDAINYLKMNRGIMQEMINEYYQRKNEAELRKKFPGLQTLHDQYQTLLELVRGSDGNDQPK